eukprot:1494388-Pyramimonas_sp.AAC.1
MPAKMLDPGRPPRLDLTPGGMREPAARRTWGRRRHVWGRLARSGAGDPADRPRGHVEPDTDQ